MVRQKEDKTGQKEDKKRTLEAISSAENAPESPLSAA